MESADEVRAALDEARNALKEQARKDIDKNEEEASKVGAIFVPEIIPRCEAIRRLREDLACEVAWPNGKGFVFKGFKGVNNMTNKELSNRLSNEPPILNRMVWDNLEFQLLFGDRRYAGPGVLGKMGLFDFGDDEDDDESEKGL
ncbi:MAG: hypothetical protein KF751_16885 [Nitrospira sp.]|nr:hypothetical protein [Nitrospira sp.]